MFVSLLSSIAVSLSMAGNSNASSPPSQDERLRSRLNMAYPIRCANLDECPSWVVGIVTNQGGAGNLTVSQNPQGVQQSRVGVCSGSLVAPDIVATNLHCLPQRLTMRDQPCSEEISFQFPKTNSEPVLTVGCEKILALSPPLEGDFLRPDYAFLKLATPVRGRLPVSVSTEGIGDLTRLTIYKIDPTPLRAEPGAGMEGVVKKVECKAVQGSIMNPYYQSQTSPLVMLSPCPIIKGNSGSGLIADDGTLRGFVSSYGELLVPEKLKKKLKEQVEKFESASGTNMSCVPWPVGDGSIPKSEACRVQTDEKTRQKLVDSLLKTEIQKSLDEINSKVNMQFKSFELAGSQLFFWQVVKAELESEERDSGVMARAKVRPMCLLPEINSILPYKTKLKNQTVLMPMKVSDYLIRERFDVYLRYQALVEEKVHNFKAKLIPRDLLREKNIEIALLFDDGNVETEDKYKLNLCYARDREKSL
ncbi:MAG: hypothetical protein JNM39_15780 [Bdellovibrionaceae bacterium]|nr:hypothetical protein [Pseudobdellovibrionaceae bacterium]